MLISNLAGVMPDFGHTFDTISFSDVPESFRKLIGKSGGTCYQMKNPKKEGYRAFKESFCRPFIENKYDLVHCHMPGYRAIAFYYFSKKFKIDRFLIHAHGKIQYGRPGLVTDFKIWLDGLINRSLSERPLGCGAKAIRDIYGPRISKDQMMIIPNGVDLANFTKSQEEREELRRRLIKRLFGGESEIPTGPIFALIGRITAVKNHKKFLDMAEACKKKAEQALFLIVGSGEDEELIKKQVLDRDLYDLVIFTGRIEPISDLYGAIDAIVLPSFSEGLPTVVIEAQAAGLPALVSSAVTKEVALVEELVKFIPLKESAETWLEAARDLSKIMRPEEGKIRKIFEKKAFTREGAGRIYSEFVKGERTTFSI